MESLSVSYDYGKSKRNVNEKIRVFVASNFCNFLQKIYCGFLKIDLGELG